MTTGGCLCGAVTFEVERPLRDVVVCHCSLCRRNSSSVGAYTSVARGGLTLVAEESLAVYVDANGRERSFCRVCGSILFWAEPGTENISIAAGALDGDTGLRTTAHIFVDSAADWEMVPRELPRHGEGLDSPRLPLAGD